MELLYLNTLQSLSLLEGNRLVQTVQELNNIYQTELNVFLEFGNGADILESAQGTFVPTLWIKNPQNQKVMKGNFTSCTLTILYLEDEHLDRGLYYLANWLWEYHHLEVLIFFNGGSYDKLIQIFSRCFNEGFVNVLVMLPGSDELYTFMPYQDLKILNLKSIKEFYSLSRKKMDLNGYNITSGLVIAGAPRWFSFRDRQNRLILTGYMLRMIVDFTNHFNGSVRLMNVLTVNDGLELLANRTIDFFPFLIRPLKSFSMSNILYLENCGLIVPTSRPLPNWVYLLRPYAFDTWIAWLIMLIYCSLALRILSKGQISISAAFLKVLRLVMYLSGSRDMGTRPTTRRLFLFVILTTSGFILTNLYVAQLSSNSAAGLYEKQINTWEDLDKSDSIWPLIDVDIKTMEKLIPDRTKLLKKIVPTLEADVDTYRRNLNTSCIHSGFFDRIDFALYQQKFLRFPIFRKFPHLLYQQPLQISAAFGRPYLQLFNWFVRKIFESGIYLKMKDDAYRHGIQSGLLNLAFRDRHLEVKSNDVEYYYLIAGLWFGGLTLATVCFLLELLIGYAKIKVTISCKMNIM
uniref:Ionotropic receptor 67b n=1 Tax=Drosophila melanogaster TaxID=7227 RepID=Q9VT95_DROME|nr:ionotropic receptor 67b [Drosophila melanogaster]AAF50158.1 ionotropic receptor 67b [Drosophila melanogaster]|eukprot:NP_648393.1 ionotropic receptor 67b [Drosophila melanogaster]